MDEKEKMEKSRNNVLTEMVMTENSYVEDLHLLLEV